MTPEELKTLLDNIVTEVNAAADMAGSIFAPALPYIAIGKAIDKMIPGIVASVDNWIQGNPPNEAEKADFVQKNAILSDPGAP
jgi:hypothetical protein